MPRICAERDNYCSLRPEGTLLMVTDDVWQLATTSLSLRIITVQRQLFKDHLSKMLILKRETEGAPDTIKCQDIYIIPSTAIHTKHNPELSSRHD